MSENQLLSKWKQKDDMGRKRYLHFKFLKVNYLNNIIYYTQKGKTPKQAFHDRIAIFFEKNETNGKIFNYRKINYRFGGLEITQDYVFGKLWKLRKKPDKDFPWNGKDYIIKQQIGKDYVFNCFMFFFKTNHLVLQDAMEYTAETLKNVFQSWFDKFYNTKNSINLQYLKDKKGFIKQLKDAHKIIRAKFTVYPSNFDYDFLSEPLDKELKRLNVNRLDQEMTSETKIKLDLKKPNVFVSPLVQSLRGNGESPKVKISDKHGFVSEISPKKRHIKREIEDTHDLNNVKRCIIKQLELILEEMKKL